MSKVVLTSFDPPARNVRRSHPTKAHPAATPGGATQGACLLIAHFTRVALHPIPSSSSSPSHAVKWSGYPTEHMGEDRRSVGRGARRGADGFEPARTAVGAPNNAVGAVTAPTSSLSAPSRSAPSRPCRQSLSLSLAATEAAARAQTVSTVYSWVSLHRGSNGGSRLYILNE